MKKLAAEFIGTFALVFAGTGAIVINDVFANHPTLGMTLPAGSAMQSFGLEFVLTTLLTLVILNVPSAQRRKALPPELRLAV